MKTLFVAVIAICFCVSGLSQKVIPPSPNAAAFNKYRDIPISAYTGIPNISVPLYVIQTGDISVPLELSYHASGIRVAEEASKVGLGWVLNAGGQITRNIVNGDDFTYSPGFYPYHNSVVSELPLTSESDRSASFNIQTTCTPSFATNEANYPSYDAEPDIYQFALPTGKSGKFMLKRNKDVVLAKDDLIQIKVMDNDATRWTIKTSDGTSYEFNQYEAYYSDMLHKTAWYLTKITSNTGSEMTFYYTVKSFVDNYIKTQGAFYENRNEGGFIFEYDGSLYCSASAPIRQQAPGKQYTNVQLDSITFKEGYVKLTYETRDDIENDTRLKAISVYAKTGASSYAMIKGNEFTYEYFAGEQDQIDDPITTYQSKRLKLKRVYELSKRNERGFYYQFDYNNETTPVALVPSKLSFARDHWGYFNGRFSNTSLIPSTIYTQTNDFIRRAIGTPGSERDASAADMNMFSIKRLWYPTGGYTDFEFEANDFDSEMAQSNFRDHSYFASFDEPPTNAVINKNYSGNRYGTFPSSFADAVANSKVLDFTGTYGNGGPAEIKLLAFFKFKTERADCAFSTEQVSFRLVDETGKEFASANIFQSMNGSPANAQCSGNNSSDFPSFTGISYSNTYLLPPGRYYWELTIPSTVTLFSDVAATFSYYERRYSTVTAGGLRIKRILDYESSTAKPKVTRYHYRYTNGTKEFSYGRQMTKPAYAYFETEPTTSNSGFETFCDFLKREGESTMPLTTNGSSVGYDKVTVYYGENGENGKTVFEYYNLPDLIWSYKGRFPTVNGPALPRKTPATPSIPYPLNGMLKTQMDYRNAGNGVFELVRSVVNNYVDKHDPNESVILGVDFRKQSYSDCPIEGRGFYIYPAFHISWVVLDNSSEVIFDQVKSDLTTTINTYNTYESQKHFQLTKTEKQVPGKSIVSLFKYPLDYTPAESSSAITLMKTNVISPVIQTRVEEWIGGQKKVLAQDITEYTISNNTMALPLRQASYQLAQPMSTELVPAYNPASPLDTTKYKLGYTISYNGSGKIASLQKPHDLPVSYLWGYQGNLPVAEIKGAYASEVLYKSFEEFGEGRASDFKTGKAAYRMDQGNISRSLAPGKYRLEYWAKGTVNISVTGTVTDLAVSPPDEKGWVLYAKQLDITTSATLVMSGPSTSMMDELRLYPYRAEITTYHYDPMIGLVQVTDTNHVMSTFEYDSFNRLSLTRDHKNNIQKMYTYNYKLK